MPRHLTTDDLVSLLDAIAATQALALALQAQEGEPGPQGQQGATGDTGASGVAGVDGALLNVSDGSPFGVPTFASGFPSGGPF